MQGGDALVPTRGHPSNSWTADFLFPSTVFCTWLLLRLLSPFLSPQGPPHPLESLEDCSSSLVAPGLQLFPTSGTTGTFFRVCGCCAEADVAEQVTLMQIPQKSQGIQNGARQSGLLSYFLQLLSTTFRWISALKLDEINLTQPKGHMAALPFSVYNTILISSYLYSSHIVSKLVLNADCGFNFFSSYLIFKQEKENLWSSSWKKRERHSWISVPPMILVSLVALNR